MSATIINSDNYFPDVVTCLQVSIHVPARAISNSTAHLECNFELENEKQIDFVNLLKDEKYFFRYSPGENDQLSSIPGMNANVSVFLLVEIIETISSIPTATTCFTKILNIRSKLTFS